MIPDIYVIDAETPLLLQDRLNQLPKNAHPTGMSLSTNMTAEQATHFLVVVETGEEDTGEIREYDVCRCSTSEQLQTYIDRFQDVDGQLTNYLGSYAVMTPGAGQHFFVGVLFRSYIPA